MQYSYDCRVASITSNQKYILWSVCNEIERKRTFGHTHESIRLHEILPSVKRKQITTIRAIHILEEKGYVKENNFKWAPTDKGWAEYNKMEKRT